MSKIEKTEMFIKQLSPFRDMLLTSRQIEILLRLDIAKEPSDRTVRALASVMEIARPAVTRGGDALEEFGLMVRVPDRQDRRSIFFEITQDGRDLVNEAIGV